MLSPDDIEKAGDMVAAVYSDIEAKMLDRLVAALLSGAALDSKDMTALALLYQTHAEELQAVIDEAGPAVSEAARESAERYLRLSDEDDLARLGEGEPAWPRQVTATVAGVAEILARDNLQMMEGAKQAFLQASVEAVTQVNTGALTREQALHRAVQKLEREGVPIITYQDRETGRVTVRNHADVAVRRHIRTQIAQDGARMTLERMEAIAVPLVEVSSHAGARPSHATWQGRCYGLNGAVTIDGVSYPDFRTSTGYGTVGGLLGANCRHSFGPYRHGAPHRFDPEPDHASGLPNDEVYKMEQGQRKLERDIRDAKRELRGAQQVYDALGGDESLAELAKAKKRLTSCQAKMRGYIERCNDKSKTGKPILHRKPYREWAGDMPKTKTPKRTQHGEHRMTERSVSDEGAMNAILSPIHSEPVTIDELGRKAQKRIGAEATVVINPDTGEIVTAYPTSRKIRRKYGAD